jgi:hypothetical protein
MKRATSDKDILRNVPSRTVKEFTRKAGQVMMQWAADHYGANRLFKNEARVYVRNRRFGQRNCASYGGISPSGYPYVNILIEPAMQTWEPRYFYEYKHISNDPIIGDVPGTNWKEFTVLLLAHEIAHTIDQCMYYDALFFDNMREVICTHEYDATDEADGHEWRWQSIYAEIRTHFHTQQFMDSIELKTEGERARNLELDSLGKVKIPHGAGSYRNRAVSGVYDLVREFKPHKGEDERNKFGDGTVVIRTPMGQKMRVSVLARLCIFETDK